MRALTLVLVMLSGSAWAVDPPAESTDLELAKAHYRTGEIYYERKRYSDAAHEFEEAYRLSNKGDLLYNMGKSYDGQGDHARALAAYRRFLRAVPSSNDRHDVEKRVEALTRLVGTITIKIPMDGSTVKFDSVEIGTLPLPAPIEANPGGHDLEVAHEGYATHREKLVVAPGSSITVDAPLKSLVTVVEVRVPEKSTPVYKKWWLWTSLAVVVVAAGGITAGVLAGGDSGVAGPSAQLPVVR